MQRLQVELMPCRNWTQRCEGWLDYLPTARLPDDVWLGGWSLGGMLASALAAPARRTLLWPADPGQQPQLRRPARLAHGMPEDTFGTFLAGCRSHTQVTLKRSRRTLRQ